MSQKKVKAGVAKVLAAVRTKQSIIFKAQRHGITNEKYQFGAFILRGGVVVG
eukprot:CAMPEP_0172519320 /NCGR_PEP_ID=MMETSP1066-20121228/291349_1 /TAXON_ID=671091 /ORGANISM="Coscinodiscus wailesii, Strain CCMP2513" /LENGTH=51 /DNA_ID=CAMNT_0013301887 /DNA_START=1500 /DNA_END=1652 /DNA_ORIENTATION=-